MEWRHKCRPYLMARRRRQQPSFGPDYVVRQLSRRRWTRRSVAAALIVLALSVILPRTGLLRTGTRDGNPQPLPSAGGNDWARFDKQQFLVTRVVDGDTLEVRSPTSGAAADVRMLGVDAPEMNFRKDQPADHWAQRAWEYLKARALNRTVTLQLEPTETRDRYGRLLAYVYLDDAENLNLSLVRDGQAYAHRSFAHTLRRQFEQAEAEARQRGRGLWKDVREDQMPEWRQRWLERNRSGRRD